MRRLDGIQPCWSCEGHERFGELWKLPQVWFYADRQVHVRVVTDAITALNQKGALQTSWEVVVTYSDPDNPETTYALRPASAETPLSLQTLQMDIGTLAETIVGLCQTQAQVLRKVTS
jgi:hypothetical protein